MSYVSVTSSAVARLQISSDIKGEFPPFTKSCNPLGISCMHFGTFLFFLPGHGNCWIHHSFHILVSPRYNEREYGSVYTAMLSACSCVTWLLD